MTGNHRISSYIKLGFLLHLVTLSEAILFIILFRALHIAGWINKGDWFPKLLALLPFISMPVFAQLDARSRFQNYKLVKDQLYLYGFRPRIMKPFIKSRCQRDAAITAAQESGMGKQCKKIFRDNGYRWYHLFPDAIFSRPGILLTKNFWMTTLFVKTYHSRIDPQKARTGKEKTKSHHF